MRVLITGVIATLLFLSVACGNGEEANKRATKPSSSPANGPAAGEPAPIIPGENGSLGQKPPGKPAEEKKETQKAAADSTPPAKINGAQIFSEQKCATCHGNDGRGKMKGAPDFTDVAWQRKEKDTELIEAVKEGKKPKMPAFGGKLKGDEIRAAVAYVRSLAKK